MLVPDYHISTAAQLDFTLAPGQLDHHVVAVTGATGGLGTVLCKALADAGATVVLIGRKLAKLEALYDALEDSDAPAPAMVEVDQATSGETDYQGIVDTIIDSLGRLDALVHTAADTGTPTPQTQIAHAEWMRVQAVNLISARLLTLACLPHLQQSPLGSIVFMLDHKPAAYWGSYGVSKSAVHALLHMLADESDTRLGDDGAPLLAINGYDPGPMRTPLRRRVFPGELESEAPLPATRLAPLLSLICRDDRLTTGVALANDAIGR